MSLKRILVVASGEAEDAHVLAVSAKFARQHGAVVNVLPAFPDPAAGLVAYGAAVGASVLDQVVERIQQSEKEAQARLASLGRDVSAAEGVAIEVAPRALQPAVALAPAAILSDLVVFGAAAARAGLAGLFAETLLSTRAPVLLVKDAPFKSSPIAVAWDGSAQAGRAVRAAMPLLAAADTVVLVRNADDSGAEDAPGMGEYLRLHGVKAVSEKSVRGERVAPSLLAGSSDAGAGVLVAGGYGRPRLYELVLGGTTRALVNAPGGAHLLLAH
mgnify:CR=1 FL=1